jgi:hypothetical protein
MEEIVISWGIIVVFLGYLFLFTQYTEFKRRKFNKLAPLYPEVKVIERNKNAGAHSIKYISHQYYSKPPFRGHPGYIETGTLTVSEEQYKRIEIGEYLFLRPVCLRLVNMGVELELEITKEPISYSDFISEISRMRDSAKY